jgi:hypothetical protein
MMPLKQSKILPPPAMRKASEKPEYVFSAGRLKKSARLSCSFSLFGLPGLSGKFRPTKYTRQTEQTE